MMGFAEILHLVAAVDGMTILYKENRMRHGGVVPFLAIIRMAEPAFLGPGLD